MYSGITIHPWQILSNDQLFHFPVMGIGHGNKPHLKSMPPCHLFNLISIIIGHQEITGKRFTEIKEMFMVNIWITVKSFACFFATSSIWWINKKYDIILISIFLKDVQPIFLPKINTAGNVMYTWKSFRQCLGIPSWSNAFTIFSMLEEAWTATYCKTFIYNILTAERLPWSY